MKTLLVTGSSGLIGSEVCAYFSCELGYAVHGVDNNQRAVFFGLQGDNRWNQQRLRIDFLPRTISKQSTRATERRGASGTGASGTFYYTHLRWYTRETMCDLLEEHGFVIDRFLAVGWIPLPGLRS